MSLNYFYKKLRKIDVKSHDSSIFIMVLGKIPPPPGKKSLDSKLNLTLTPHRIFFFRFLILLTLVGISKKFLVDYPKNTKKQAKLICIDLIEI